MMLCGEPRLPYDRVRLSEILVSGESADALALRPPEWYADRGVEVRLGAWVTAARPAGAGRHAGLAGRRSARRCPYSQLVLATGSQPLMPPIEGIDLPGVYAFRGPEDCESIRAAAAESQHAAVIGGGLLGLEAARGVVAQGARGHGGPPDGAPDGAPARPRCRRDARAGDDRPRRRGPARAPDDVAERATAASSALHFADGESLAADLVVVSIGIRAETTLARGAGITCGRGIVVDDRMRTSAAGVLAVGECAEHRGVVYGLVAPIHEQAKVAADTLLRRIGLDYAGSIPSAKLKVMGVDLVSIGEAEADQSAIAEFREDRIYRKLVLRDGTISGAMLMGDIRGHENLLEAVRAGEARAPTRSPGWSPPARRRRPTCRTRPRSATATASARARSSRPSTTACPPRAR